MTSVWPVLYGTIEQEVVVKELHELGRSDAWIAKHLGMDRDEILRLKQITGLAALFKEVDFSQSWEPVEDEEQLQSIEDQFVDA